MSSPAGYVADLLLGLIGELVTAGVGVYSTTTTYAATDRGIGIGQLPEQCDKALMLTPYGPEDPFAELTEGVQGVQVWVRGARDDLLSAIGLQSAAFAALQGLTNRQYGACHVGLVSRKSSVPMGMDSNRRWEISDNYSIDLNTPTTAYRN